MTEEVPTSFDSPESSSVQRAEYDAATRTLTVELRPGRTYVYHQFPEEKWADFQSASSKGGYFAAEIRPCYVGRRK